jgi:uncharacterized membrane protein YebE (DUF533 family)
MEGDMNGAKSLLDGLLGGLTQGGGLGGGLGGLAESAMKTWNAQSKTTQGAIGGAVLGTLLTKGGRNVLGSGAEIGGAALIGALAMKAFAAWQDGSAATDAAAAPMQDPTGTSFLPKDAAQADDLAARLLQAMVAAVKADGTVGEAEREAVNVQVAQLKMDGNDASAVIAQEMAAPLDVGRIAGLARNPEEAAAIYTASALVVNRNGAAEKGYLGMLAARLGLEPALVNHLNAVAGGAA